jgi:hypothetical protein
MIGIKLLSLAGSLPQGCYLSISRLALALYGMANIGAHFGLPNTPSATLPIHAVNMKKGWS